MTDDRVVLADDALRVYLRDHHAGAVAGTALAQQIASHNAETSLADKTATLAAEIAADMKTLESVMIELKVPTSRVKDLTAAIGERITQLKPNAEFTGPRPLTRLIEFESLSAGITGKAALWRTLQVISTTDRRLAEFDFAALAERAYDQRERVDACHASEVAAAFTSPS